ncbi:MAG: hypothetical protein ISS33_05115 [Candidatus Omnitrophica bacterium]|nr:hypothetical protein [Candidatus Omnitrophota bacterium]
MTNEHEKETGSKYPVKEENREKWYFKPVSILGAILLFGPLGLLPLWFRPKTKLWMKILVSVVVIGLTVIMTIETVNIYQKMLTHFENVSQMYAP